MSDRSRRRLRRRWPDVSSRFCLSMTAAPTARRRQCSPRARRSRECVCCGIHFGAGRARLWPPACATRAEWIGTLDGDGQNDPADLPKLIAARLQPENASIFCSRGIARHARTRAFASCSRASQTAFALKMLGDGTPDTGWRHQADESRGVHGPAEVRSHASLSPGVVPARGRAGRLRAGESSATRPSGTSKYGMLNRPWVGIVDIFGVMWLRRRYKLGLTVREE